MDIVIYTSYFGNIKNVKYPVAICGKSPEWYTGPKFTALAPKYDFYIDYKNGKIDEAGYTEQFYSRILSQFDPMGLVNQLMHQFGNQIALLCYEKPGDFCHRRLVADFITNGTNIPVLEL